MIFSIIIPLYKVEEYVEHCIKSVLNQDFNDYEMILVNDGSPDCCGEICERYATIDNRIKVIHKANGGLSDARNAGLNIAKGKYVIFLDGDDYLEQGILKKLFDILISNNNPDIITCTNINVYPNGEMENLHLQLRPLSQVIDKEHLFNEFVRTSCADWSAGKNVYKLETIKNKKIEFKSGLIGAEDCDFFMRYVRLTNRFIFFDSPLINYRKNRKGSITESMTKDAIIGQLTVFSENYYIYKDNRNVQKYFAQKFANTIFLLFHLKNKKERKECVDFICKHKLIIKKAQKPKYLFARCIWLLFGYYDGSILLKKINSLLRKR